MRPAWHVGLVLLALGLPSRRLCAQEVDLGAQIAASVPIGVIGGKDWLDKRLGEGVGVHVAIGFDTGVALVPRMDYTSYDKTSAGVDRRVQMFQLGADLEFFFSQRLNDGPYLGGGMGFGAARFTLGSAGQSTRSTPDTAWMSANFGWMFTRHLGAEFRLSSSEYKPKFPGSLPPGYDPQPWIAAPLVSVSFLGRY